MISILLKILPKPKAKKTVQEPNSPELDSYQPKLPYLERMKVREKYTPSAQQSRFMKLFKQLRLEIGLKDASSSEKSKINPMGLSRSTCTRISKNLNALDYGGAVARPPRPSAPSARAVERRRPRSPPAG
ncbi:hypothetical protein Tco_0321054 [Tanacetum coccineum]